jgi:hypothetical protein
MFYRIISGTMSMAEVLEFEEQLDTRNVTQIIVQNGISQEYLDRLQACYPAVPIVDQRVTLDTAPAAARWSDDFIECVGRLGRRFARRLDEFLNGLRDWPLY